MNYHKYLRAEEVDWKWTYDPKTMVHKLTLIHLSTQKSVTGELHEVKVPRGKLFEKKHNLKEDLLGKLEDLVFE